MSDNRIPLSESLPVNIQDMIVSMLDQNQGTIWTRVNISNRLIEIRNTIDKAITIFEQQKKTGNTKKK